ncbi:hypothetical protein Tco_0917807 [Tanacetum coccineum]
MKQKLPLNSDFLCNLEHATTHNKLQINKPVILARGYQFLGKRLISWQCKKQTIVANSTTEAEYVAAANCYGQVLWIQNQMLDYGFNFMNTQIFIDNESTISIVKNLIHTDHDVADLLSKAFDVSSCKVNTARQKISTAKQKLVLLSQNETVYKEWEDRMEKAATTASSLDAEQDSDNINRTHSMATLNESFHQGTNSGSGLSFALTDNTTIFNSLIQQFWQIASTSTLEDGEVEITATIDGQLKTITEASLRRHLKLEDVMVLVHLPNTEIFEQLALMGFIQILLNKHQRLLLPHKRTYVAPTLTQKLFSNMRRVSKVILDWTSPIIFKHDFLGFQFQQGEGSTVPVGVPSHTHHYSIHLNNHFHHPPGWKKVGENSQVKKDRKMIKELLCSDDEKVLENSSKTPPDKYSRKNHPEDQFRSLSAGYGTSDVLREPLIKKSQRIARYAKIALRLQEEIDAVGRQRMAKVHQAAQGFTEDEWENIRARVEADEELTQKLQAKEKEKYSEVDQAKMLVDLINQRKRVFAQQRAKAKRNKPMTQA